MKRALLSTCSSAYSGKYQLIPVTIKSTMNDTFLSFRAPSSPAPMDIDEGPDILRAYSVSIGKRGVVKVYHYDLIGLRMVRGGAGAWSKEQRNAMKKGAWGHSILFLN
jgi:hypothetical protein